MSRLDGAAYRPEWTPTYATGLASSSGGAALTMGNPISCIVVMWMRLNRCRRELDELRCRTTFASFDGSSEIDDLRVTVDVIEEAKAVESLVEARL